MLFRVDTELALDEVSVRGDIILSKRPLLLNVFCDEVRLSRVPSELALAFISLFVSEPCLLPFNPFLLIGAAATGGGWFDSAVIRDINRSPACALRAKPDAAVVFEGEATVFTCEMGEIPNAAFFVPVAAAEDAETCVAGTGLFGDAVFRGASSLLDVVVDALLLLALFTLSYSFLLSRLRFAVPVPDGTIVRIFFP